MHGLNASRIKVTHRKVILSFINCFFVGMEMYVGSGSHSLPMLQLFESGI